MNYEIIQDFDPINPRDNECLGTILYISNHYCLGDKRVSPEYLEEIMNNNNNIVLPVYAYIHSGVSMNTTGFDCPWDSGQSGCIYVSKDKARQFLGLSQISNKNLQQIKDHLREEVEEFSMYLNGDVYGFIIRDDKGNELDSCYNLFGRDIAEKEAKISMNHIMSKKLLV